MDGQEGFLPVRLCGRLCALSVAEVEAVMQLPRSAVSPVPFAEGTALGGILLYKGTAVAVLRQPGEGNGSGLLTVVLLRTGTGPVALPAESVEAICPVCPEGAELLTVTALTGGKTR